MLQADLDERGPARGLAPQGGCRASGPCGCCTGAASRRCTCWARTSGPTCAGECGRRARPTPASAPGARRSRPRKSQDPSGTRGRTDSLPPAPTAPHPGGPPVPRNTKTLAQKPDSPNLCQPLRNPVSLPDTVTQPQLPRYPFPGFPSPAPQSSNRLALSGTQGDLSTPSASPPASLPFHFPLSPQKLPSSSCLPLPLRPTRLATHLSPAPHPTPRSAEPPRGFAASCPRADPGPGGCSGSDFSPWGLLLVAYLQTLAVSSMSPNAFLRLHPGVS